MPIRRRAVIFFIVSAASGVLTAAGAESYDSGLLRELRWRMIGPHRGGRTKAAAGIPDRPSVFYVGACNGGVWKTDDYGRTWRPIFDDQPTGSVGAIAIAPSRPDVIYVGSGEGLQRPDLSTGDGIYRSTDGGATWRHLGLRQGRQIPQIAVDPRDPNRLFVAVLGSPYGPGPERGLFRSTDGGESFQKVLSRDEDTGAVDVVLDPKDARTVYAVLWESRQAPWENGVFNGPGSGLYKSTDGGDTWRPLTKGLPTFADDGLGRIGITVAPSDPRRLFATVEAKHNGGLYRSDDAGESWARVNADPRVTERGSDFAEVKVHPTDPDTVFTASVVTWKSTDGGKTFTAFRGAPGGDDYHRIWINPRQPEVMLIASDQGVIVTVNGGASWSSWYNQPTAQFYHVSTDNAFPYRVCGGQQESGSVCITSRSDDGAITFREWHPVAVEEYGYVAADPLDPDVVYGGRLTRYDRRTDQAQNVTPRALRSPSFRVLRTAPVLFSPTDPHTLYFASNTLWKTSDGGATWTEISPDLTRATWEAPPNVGKYRGTDAAKPTRRGVIYTVAPSPVDGQRIWAGTDDGLIHVTADGGRTWTDVTPPALRDRPWSKISLIDASHFDAGTAYAAINTFRVDDLRPHIYRTRDGGRSWSEITAGIPDGGIVNAVREDPGRRGLLFAGTEQAVYVSFDDGESWQSLRLNMPATSIRDLVVKDDDLVLGTHGRGFWILDDITPLRQLAPAALQETALLFAPQEAWRFRWNKNPDTPLPPDEPAGQNPPDGAIVHYFLKAAAGPVSLEIVDAGGNVVRRYRSDDTPEPPVEGRNIPDYWIRPPQTLSAAAGLHRFVWDLHYPPPPTLERSYPIAAIYRDTPAEPRGPWAVPGAYTVRLTVGGRTLTRPLRLKMDPRVKATPAELQRQLEASQEIVRDLARTAEAVRRVKERSRTDSTRTRELGERETKLTALNGRLATVYGILQEVDAAPTAAALRSAQDLRQELDAALAATPPVAATPP
ncbi:MAG: glycoside hydrolase [Acidobacteria bacterium]|nr:MAG: glycoside hydrolase [Acidobacteriota bacterium]